MDPKVLNNLKSKYKDIEPIGLLKTTRNPPVPKPKFGKPSVAPSLDNNLLKTMPTYPLFPGDIQPELVDTLDEYEAATVEDMKVIDISDNESEEDNSEFSDINKNGILDILKLHRERAGMGAADGVVVQLTDYEKEKLKEVTLKQMKLQEGQPRAVFKLNYNNLLTLGLRKNI